MPDDASDEQTLNAEFDALAGRAGIEIPESRRPAMLEGLKDLKRMTQLMRQPRTAANEPAGAYAILSITRSV
ncbi:hypothetical protein [Bradyrhizobium sp. LHD-71]|uniref:hypothetical protein n=1 Tax=Bradyrhizobium sp. LHD-71 TaxID=3072141 RepID=UPI00280EE261|nr:hypothetical protein [Bradyrhizobium sp. LHD-71]MDQ8727685.1 hypothetical protein [Bradyrhizobium sp. LHD-71]